MSEPSSADVNHYRPCVGIMLLNRAGLVFIGKRKAKRTSDAIGAGFLWQMPQGGIDPGEDPYTAAVRELAEETNVTSVEKLAEAPDWYTYDLPVDASKKAWRGRYQGQRQKWFALRFRGQDADIALDLDGHPEFSAWRWAELAELPGLVVPFKRAIYEILVRDFSRFATAS
jgi:putative (di)nucleoside polyphosphate hydrolase